MTIPIDDGRAMSLSPITDIIADLKAGRMAVLVDEEDRENEGDLIFAADFVTADKINFMATHGRGLICMAVTAAHAERLNLAPMVAQNRSVHGTNFTVSIEAAQGVATGISATDRAHTIRVAAAADAKPSDIVQPGHVFPLIAQPGGVLARAGHTEACCDLAALAGLTPAAVLCEIMNADGTMARLPDLVDFARTMVSRSARSPISSRTAAAPSGSSSASPSGRSRPRTARSGWSSTATSSRTRRISRSCAARCRRIPRRSCACTSRCP